MAKTKAEKAAYAREWRARNKERVNAERRERYAANSEYRERIAEETKRYRTTHADAYKKSQALKYQKHGAKYRAKQAEDRAANPEKYRARAAEQRVTHADRISKEKLAWERQDRAKNPEKYREKQRKHVDANRAKYRARWAKRRALKKNAMPPWANEFFIEEAYELARLRTELTGVPWEVDHIIPLQHPDFCGLHIPENLQVITRSENRVKSNSVG